MDCAHPRCPRGDGARDWDEVLDHLDCTIRADQRALLLSRLGDLGAPGEGRVEFGDISATVRKRLLERAPCLYTQTEIRCSASAIVHLCECTIGAPIDATNVVRAFEIQHPHKGELFANPPVSPAASVGDISEALCSAVLTSSRIPAMKPDRDGWPIWEMPGHISLNSGKMQAVKAFGDILIPAAPTNLTVSVKSEVARERLLYSANSIEGVGFGFFKEAEEFWTKSRMRLLKRMGFTAIYLPSETLQQIKGELERKHLESHSVNINGTALYRPIEDFGADMFRIVGKITLDL